MPVQDMEIKAGIIPGEGIIVEGGKKLSYHRFSLSLWQTIFDLT
jgi:hypothetical protein